MFRNDPQSVLTGEVRCSYVHLVEPRATLNGDLKYQVTLLIPKSDTATKAEIDSAIAAAATAAVNTKWNGTRPQNIPVVIHDGDGARPSGEPFGEECKGCWVMTASSNNKPEVVGMDNVRAPLPPTDIYSGMYARVTIRFYGYSAGGKKGVACGLGNVMKTRDGDSLTGRTTAASDFAEFANGGASATPQPAINPITGQPIA